MSQPTVRAANKNSDITFQNAAVATGNGTALTVEGASACLVQVNGITTATITFEASVDETNYVAIQAMNMATGAAATTTTADGLFFINTTGQHLLRCRISAWTSGTITVKGRSTTLAVLGSVANLTVDTEFPAAAALADATANPTTTLVGALLEAFNGTTWDRLRGDITNGLDVDVTRAPSAQTTTSYTETAANSAAGGTLITIAAVAGQKHRVFAYDVSAAGATTITIADGATTLQRHFIGGNGGIVKDPMPSGTAWFTGTANTALTVASSAAVDVSVRIYTTTAA